MNDIKNVPVEPDTRIIQQKEIKVGAIPSLYQHWSWEGIIAESIIFHDKDVQSLSDEELFQMISFHADPDGQYTVSRSCSGYTFINFNFRH